jgi:hypothetical protein
MTLNDKAGKSTTLKTAYKENYQQYQEKEM